MREATKEELEKFREIDGIILKAVKNLNEDNFKKLWINEKECKKHIKKRIAEGVIKDENDYIEKIKIAFLYPDEIKWKKYKNEFKQKHNRMDRIYYKKGDMWVDVFFEDGKLSTAFVLKKRYEDILLKGNKRTFDIIDIDARRVR